MQNLETNKKRDGNFMRYDRDYFTQKLEKLAASLATEKEYHIRYTGRYHDSERQSIIRPKALWVFGSWARGSAECGDLDLIVDVESIEGFTPPGNEIAKALNRSRSISMYAGTPGKNTSGVEVEDAVLIWSPETPDWKNNIAAVKVDATASRFVRKSDEAPLRSYQVNCMEFLEQIIDWHDNKVLSWEWIPLDEIAPDPSRWHDSVKDYYARKTQSWGKNTRKMLPYILEYVAGKGISIDNVNHYFHNKSEGYIDGTLIDVGIADLYHVQLLDRLEYSAVMFAPHITRKGPNGIWIIRRGEEHPVEKMYRDIKLYTVAWDDSYGITIVGEDFYDNFFELELCSTKRRAGYVKMRWEKARIEEEDYQPIVSVVALEGSELLKAISAADVVYFDGTPLATTFEGCRSISYCYEKTQENPLNAAELAEIFRNCLNNKRRKESTGA